MTPSRLLLLVAVFAALLTGFARAQSPWSHGPIRATADGRQLQHADGTPFFWLADTAWLITQKLNREEVRIYFENRRAKGFNVVQCCVVQFLNDKSFNGSLAVLDNDIARLRVTPGSNPADALQYDYWDHVDYVIETAAANGIYLAMAPVWSHMVRRTPLTAAGVGPYIEQLAGRYKDRPNVIWLNGGSARGSENADVWQTIGGTLKRIAPAQPVTFHVFGRTQSSTWFQDAPWLDFNLFTSGHRRYDQDTEGRRYGEDNWRYVLDDLAKSPRKPTLDCEPAYENTPQGLHDHGQPYWGAGDARRYAYWSVFAGAAGHTYGENSVRQIYLPSETKPASGARGFIMERLDTEGAGQMRHLRNLVLSRPFFGRRNDQSLVAGDEGEKYDRVLVTRGDGYVMAYAYTGRNFTLQLGALGGAKFKASWFNPRTGEVTVAGVPSGSGAATFNPPGDPSAGNDWVLVLDDDSRSFEAPGTLSARASAGVAGTVALRWSADLLRRKPAWYASAEARAAADNVLRYQSPEGAWPKNTDLLAPATAVAIAEVNRAGKGNTIDNGATTVPMQFLALVASATGADDCRQAVVRGLDYLLSSQFRNGGFPQFFPLRKGYYSHITYNDGAMINAISLLREVAEGRPPFAWVTPDRRAVAAAAVARGIDCIIKTQIKQEGRLTVWCAQHDEVTLAPTWARAYEPPSLSGGESVGIVRFLMSIEQPSAEVVSAIEGAVAWFRKVAMTGQRLDRVPRSDGRTEHVLVADPAAPLLWARFYELGSDRPLYMDRNSKPVYDFTQIDYERRIGYNYHGTWPAGLLERDYPAWRAKRVKSS
ncbi:pectate lyase [Horticoccus sp. 23ND18S-11]|uniref:pectate lyase n=1 Tax=Horticoccus sp. 23ND18S-11 TaxID=3391832 RepID=UPI0039C980EF